MTTHDEFFDPSGRMAKLEGGYMVDVNAAKAEANKQKKAALWADLERTANELAAAAETDRQQADASRAALWTAQMVAAAERQYLTGENDFRTLAEGVRRTAGADAALDFANRVHKGEALDAFDVTEASEYIDEVAKQQKLVQFTRTLQVQLDAERQHKEAEAKLQADIAAVLPAFKAEFRDFGKYEAQIAAAVAGNDVSTPEQARTVLESAYRGAKAIEHAEMTAEVYSAFDAGEYLPTGFMVEAGKEPARFDAEKKKAETAEALFTGRVEAGELASREAQREEGWREFATISDPTPAEVELKRAESAMPPSIATGSEKAS